MRFLADGPWIPDDLLNARDEGRVIFFCGAGISRARAGLPDFFGLARNVVDTLGVDADDPARKILDEAHGLGQRIGIYGLISADRIFGLLERSFTTKDIEAAVAKALKPPKDADLSAHKIMLDLAVGPDGKTRLVTTNIELLFEACDSSINCCSPTLLPDPNKSENFEGIIHLHGHVDTSYSGAAGEGFILSSSEFGRAYLSDGWATKFIKTILEKYTVVFVGYSADDPPVQYLLEALNNHVSTLHDIYAFHAGSQNEAEAQWRHKGVYPIAYDLSDDHRALWDTLAAWAIRARDPAKWITDLASETQKGPAALKPHQRGQVAHIVSTLEGARQLLGTDPPPPAEWLCVFDPAMRFSKPGRVGLLYEDGIYFDPFEAYGLDSDVVPSMIDPNEVWSKREVPAGAWDAFLFNRLDSLNLTHNNFADFRGHSRVHIPALPPRLWQVCIWLGQVSHQHCAVWWASHQRGLHPQVQDMILHNLQGRKAKVPAHVAVAWRYLFEAFESNEGALQGDFYHHQASIAITGWTSASIRDLGQIYRPRLKVKKPYWRGPKPPEEGARLDLADLLHLEVEYPFFSERPEIPNNHLLAFVREMRKNLEYAVALEEETGGFDLRHLCPFERDPTLEGEESERHYGASRYVLFYIELITALTTLDEKAAKEEVAAWWTEEILFSRLRVWACGQHKLVSGAEAGRIICGLSDLAFWDRRGQRDLLLTLHQRWSEFTKAARRRIERWLLKGRKRWPQEKLEQYKEDRAWQTLTRIHWLDTHGVQLGLDVPSVTAQLGHLTPDWKPQYAAKAAASLEGRGGFVKTDTSFSILLGVPLKDVISTAADLTGREHERLVQNDPFSGLVAARPVRALAALTTSSNGGEYPEWAWKTYLQSQARSTDRPRLTIVIAARLSLLPLKTLGNILYAATEWLTNVSSVLFLHRTQFEMVWTKLIEAIVADPCIGKSSLMVRGGTQQWATEALNSPVGKMAQVLVSDPQAVKGQRKKGFSAEWLKHVEELLALPDDQRRHALVMLAHQLHWLYAVDRTWSTSHLLSILSGENLDDQDAFWDGFFWAAQVPNHKLFITLKPYLLKIAVAGTATSRKESEVLAGILLAGWGSICKETGERFVSSGEIRNIILSTHEQFRGQVLWQLERWSENKDGKWAALAPTFIAEAWPRQKMVKSPATSGRLCNLAFSNEKLFPVLADAILPLVTEMDCNHVFLPNLRKKESKIIDKYPEKAVALLFAILPEKVSAWPYGIEDVLLRIEAVAPAFKNDSRYVDLKRRWDSR